MNRNNLKEIFTEISESIHFSSYPGLKDLLLRYCAAIIFRFLKFGETPLELGEKLNIEKLCKDLKVISPYNSFIMRMLEILEEGNYITVEDDEFTINTIETKSDEFFRFKTQTIFPRFSPFFSLLDHCSKNYTRVLSGEVSSYSVLFPPDDPNLIPNTLQLTPRIGFQQPCLEAVQRHLTLHQNECDHLRILEVGGGQGILTERLLPVIDPKKVSYCFTDIGEYFVRNGKKRWSSRYPFLKYGTFDISMNPDKQAFEAGEYDVVLAFNVIHATSDILASLRQLSKVIRGNGCFCLIEDVKALPWIDLIYGITKEWWEHSDNLRKLSPQLSVNEWKKVLCRAGFDIESVYPISELIEAGEREVDIASFFCRKRLS